MLFLGLTLLFGGGIDQAMRVLGLPAELLLLPVEVCGRGFE